MFRAVVLYTNPMEEDALAMQRGLRVGLKKGTEHWQRVIAPRHFKPGAATKYGYQRRTKAYSERKFRRFGHRLPLVWTGESEMWIRTRRARARISVSGTNVTGVLNIKAPRHFWAFRKDRRASDKVAELTTTIPSEAEVLGEIVADEIDASLARGLRPRRKRVS